VIKVLTVNCIQPVANWQAQFVVLSRSQRQVGPTLCVFATLNMKCSSIATGPSFLLDYLDYY